jgi:hypothetical protein
MTADVILAAQPASTSIFDSHVRTARPTEMPESFFQQTSAGLAAVAGVGLIGPV